MFKKILICLDGSKLAEQVLPVAIETARANNARLILFRTIFEYSLHSPNIPGYAGMAVQTGNIAKRLEVDLELASTYLNSTAESIKKETGLEVSVEIALGTAGKSIVEYVEENRIDLVVLATHGHGGLERIVFGSTADFILKRSHVPNLILRPKAIEDLEEKSYTSSPIRKILVPLDGSHLAEQILPYAVEQARLFSSKLVLLHVINTPESEVTVSLKATTSVAEKEKAYYEYENKEASNYLMTMADSYQKSAIDAEWIVLHGENPQEMIMHYANTYGCHMIAMCTHGRGGLNRMVFGSVADHILRSAGPPLLVLRPHHRD
jgi:nucleotide-binding universal stress UspA family protein